MTDTVPAKAGGCHFDSIFDQCKAKGPFDSIKRLRFFLGKGALVLLKTVESNGF